MAKIIYLLIRWRLFTYLSALWLEIEWRLSFISSKRTACCSERKSRVSTISCMSTCAEIVGIVTGSGIVTGIVIAKKWITFSKTFFKF